MKIKSFRKESPKSNPSSIFRKRNKSGFFRRGSSFFNAIQAKMAVNGQEDKQEQEADAMSDQVAQRQMAPEKEKEDKIQKKDALKEEKDKEEVQKKEEEDKEKVQAKGEGTAIAPRHVETSIHNTKGKGTPLPSSVNTEMGSAFGNDFSTVRIHTDSNAIDLNKKLNAQAFTHGSDIYFNQGKYDANSVAGKKLLAHELTHVIQQNGYSGEEQEHAPGQIQRYESGEHAQFGETGDAMKQIVAGDTFPYEVKEGDTLAKIASKFGVSADSIASLNASKVKSWPSKDKGKIIKGFATGEKITVPRKQNEATQAALQKKELTMNINGLTVEYGVGIAMGDLFTDPAEMFRTPKNKLEKLAELVRKEKSGKTVTTKEWQDASDGRYLKLAEKNEAHFAPPNKELADVSGKSGDDHQSKWQGYHTDGLKKSRDGKKDEALATNAFADHFLTDAFAGGHLINKRDVMEKFKARLTVDSKGEFTKGAEAFFKAVADSAFTGAVKTEFSKYETVALYNLSGKEDPKGSFHPNIDSAERFASLLQAIQKAEPDLLANAVAKAVHDTLNKMTGGIPVENAMGDQWDLSGDGTLNTKSKEIGQKAVAQSQLNILGVFKVPKPLDLPALFKKVWSYVPFPGKKGVKEIKPQVESGTDPKEAALIAAITKLINENYPIIINELVARKKLQKA